MLSELQLPFLSKKNGEISNMNLFVIFFILTALLYVLMLPFVGKRGTKAHTEEEIEDGTHENLCQ